MKVQIKITEYDQQAIDFLESTGTKLDIKYLYTGSYFPDDTDQRDIYQFTLTNDKGSYSAQFGDSLNNTKLNHFRTTKRTCDYKEDYAFCKANKIPVSASGRIMVSAQKRVNPSAYDILACLDSYVPDTFEEFCSEYGYNEQPLSDHNKVMSIYLKCKEQASGLKAIFSESELYQLTEIA